MTLEQLKAKYGFDEFNMFYCSRNGLLARYQVVIGWHPGGLARGVGHNSKFAMARAVRDARNKGLIK